MEVGCSGHGRMLLVLSRTYPLYLCVSWSLGVTDGLEGIKDGYEIQLNNSGMKNEKQMMTIFFSSFVSLQVSVRKYASSW